MIRSFGMLRGRKFDVILVSFLWSHLLQWQSAQLALALPLMAMPAGAEMPAPKNGEPLSGEFELLNALTVLLPLLTTQMYPAGSTAMPVGASKPVKGVLGSIKPVPAS